MKKFLIALSMFLFSNLLSVKNKKISLNNSQNIFIYGPMGSGKTKKLICLINQLNIEDPEGTSIFTHKWEKNRSNGNGLVSKDKNYEHIKAKYVSNFNEILFSIQNKNIKTIVVDEIQFLDTDDLDKLLSYCKNNRIRVIFAGLDKDFTGKCFGNIIQTIKDNQTFSKIQLRSFCDLCQKSNKKSPKAENTLKTINGLPAPFWSNQISIDKENKEIKYNPACDDCLNKAYKKNKQLFLIPRNKLIKNY
jgi:thymidine kinase